MNLLEAIKNCGDNWFRPVGWKNKNGYRIKNGAIIYCELDYEENYFLRDVDLLVGEWEIVDPKFFN